MRTHETIAQNIVSLEPTLHTQQVLDALPSVPVRKLRQGCEITLRVRDPDLGVEPAIVLRFDAEALLVQAVWRQTFPDVESSANVFKALGRLVQVQMDFPPDRYACAGSRKARTSLTNRWRICKRQAVILTVTQTKARSLSREVVLTNQIKPALSTGVRS